MREELYLAGAIEDHVLIYTTSATILLLIEVDMRTSELLQALLKPLEIVL